MPHPNLADPDFEPTDEDFAELCRSAFAEVNDQHEKCLLALRASIDSGRLEARKLLANVGRE